MNSLKILTLNTGLLEIDFPLLRTITIVKRKNLRVYAVIDALKKTTHDIVMFQEVGGSLLKKILRELSDIFPYHVTHHARKLFSTNLLILSKLPFTKTDFIPFTSQTHFESWGIQKGMLCASVRWNSTDYHFINTHLVASGTEQRDTSKSALRVRNNQINQIKKYINETYHDNDHVIIGGDFNMGPHTSLENYHLMISELKDCMEHIHEHERITWNPKNPLTRNRVIHDPEKQIDGFYMKHAHYDEMKDNITINRMFLDEVSFHHEEKTVSTMISDHYGVELIIKKHLN